MNFMKKYFFQIIVLFVILLSSMISAVSPGGDDYRKVDNKSFREGEKLTFAVKYGFVTAGIAVMSVPKVKKMLGRNVYNIMFEVNSVPTFDWIFKVRDRYETYLDVEGLFPWRFEQHIREGKYSRDFSAFFDHKKLKAKTSEGEFPIPKYVNDIVSAFYFARTIDYSKMKTGESIKLYNFYKDKTYDLDVRYVGKERVTVSAGTFDCVIVEPIIKEGGLFKTEGSIFIWMTDDKIKMPVKVKTKIIIGSIDAELTAYEGLAGPLSSKK